MWSALALIVGCLPTPGAVGLQSDAGDAAEDTQDGLVVRSASGDLWPAAASPRRPRLEVHVRGGGFGDPEPVLLVRGSVSAALRTDLERAPLTAASQGLIVPTHVSRAGDVITLVPTTPLELGAQYSVVVAGWARHGDGRALDAVLVYTLEVAPGGAGASLTATFPPDRASGLPTMLPRVFLVFDDEVTGIDDIYLEHEDGARVPGETMREACSEVGFDAPACVVLSPESELSPSTSYALVVGEGVHDRGGASVGYVSSLFSTGGGDFPLTTLAPGTCTIDERTIDVACALVQDDTIRLRATASRAVYGALDVGIQRVPFFAPRGEITVLVESLLPSAPLPSSLFVTDASGETSRHDLALQTADPIARIVLSELRSDPSGPEPAQEYVELLSLADEDTDLSGFTLSDRADALGDVLPSGTRLEAHARLLLVADGFDPHHPEDEPVPPGVKLVRIGTSIASSGITNGGEPLFLRDALGRRVAESPALASTGEGRCIVRVQGTSRVPRPGDYIVQEGAPCSPGF